MAPRFNIPALLLATALALVGCAGTRDLDLGYQTGYSDDGYVYDDLASYGAWVDVAPYGWVWCPDAAASWQPYTVGYWVSTDDGWFWVSDDPWGSVPYHYGRWAFADDYGWVWVPGDVWAPAWCAWRYGDGWVGWAPLPPDVPWLIPVGIDLSADDLDQRIRRRYWSFTKADEFGTRRERVRVEPTDRSEALFTRTRNVTKYASGARPVEEGLRPELIRELRGKTLERYRIVDSEKPVSKSGLRIRGREAQVYRPSAEVMAVVRDHMRAVPSRTPSKPASPVRERAEREPEKPIQAAQREEVTHEESRDSRGVTRPEDFAQERRQVPRKRPEPVQTSLVTRDDNVRDRIERVARQREESVRQEGAARQREREEAARQREREEVARQRERNKVAQQREREEPVREREEAARQREEAAREREEALRSRESNARHRKAESPSREQGTRKQDPPERKKDTAHSGR
jgi:hypothetical protein